MLSMLILLRLKTQVSRVVKQDAFSYMVHTFMKMSVPMQICNSTPGQPQ